MSKPPPHVLVLSPGAKVGLVRSLAESVAARGGTLSGWESDPFSPAGALCSRRFKGGAVEDGAAVSTLLEWCVAEHVHLVVPTRHDDLPALASARERFLAEGVKLAVSAPECVRLCHDKVASHGWLGGLGFPVPTQLIAAEAAAGFPPGGFPLVAKHPRGSGSRQLRVCRSPADLAGLQPEWIVQTLAPGLEFTVNTYVARDGRCRCEIPHERLMTSEGEVVRGRTARIPALMDIARRISEALPGARGPLNIQIFWDAPTGRATVIEINPRFGGGYPLAHRAGGCFTEWLLAEYIDGATLPRCDTWQDGLTMVRYREAMFFPAGP